MIEVKLNNLSYNFAFGENQKKKVLSNISLNIRSGEQVAIIGSSGAGKTSLLKAIIFANRPTEGSIFFSGIDPWKLTGGARHNLRSKLCYVPQDPPMPPRQRVVHSVISGKLPSMGLVESFLSLIYPKFVKSAYKALEEFNLETKLYERVDKLSGGERQRISIARALMSEASLWAVDEPLSALDPDSAETTMSVLKEHASARGVTFICTLHQVNMALKFFPRIIGIQEGKIFFDSPTSSIDQSLLMKVYEAENK